MRIKVRDRRTLVALAFMESVLERDTLKRDVMRARHNVSVERERRYVAEIALAKQERVSTELRAMLARRGVTHEEIDKAIEDVTVPIRRTVRKSKSKATLAKRRTTVAV